MLKNLLGNGARERELADEMRAILDEMRQERTRFETLLATSRDAEERLAGLSEPLAKAGSDVLAVTGRLGDAEQRLDVLSRLADQIESLDQRAGTIAERQGQTESQFSGRVDDRPVSFWAADTNGLQR